ncbi:MAG TPA: NifU family protein [Acidobacteriota bacterium]|nr:NifU family protein [Acidobacteriota bacterium]
MADEARHIEITGEPTLDAQVCKFTVDCEILPESTLTCRSRDTARGSPLLEALFEIEGVGQVMVCGNTLTIVKTSNEDWPVLGQKIGTVIREQIASGKQLIASDADLKTPSEEEIRDKVQALFEQQINPAISGHGGRVELVDVEGTTIHVRLAGGCQGCASAAMTLRHGIERAIRQLVPEVTGVVDDTDHTVGTDPYLR